MEGHAVFDMEGYMFNPQYFDWGTRVENTTELTYPPIFRIGKKLNCRSTANEGHITKNLGIRQINV